jgi:hypothetical protein
MSDAISKKTKKVAGLYLCQFSQGTIKIGMGWDTSARLASHKAAGAVFGISVVRTDVIPCDHLKKAEKLLIEWCAEHSTACNGREWFDGMDYEACLSAARLATLTMMGPHPEQSPKRDIVQAIMDSCKKPLTKEADLYCAVREMMVRNQIPAGVVEALDYLHRESEKVREAMRAGGPMPEWFDLLNCFEFWEIELWFDQGRPSIELLSAAAEAIGTIEKIEATKEIDHA